MSKHIESSINSSWHQAKWRSWYEEKININSFSTLTFELRLNSIWAGKQIFNKFLAASKSVFFRITGSQNSIYIFKTGLWSLLGW